MGEISCEAIYRSVKGFNRHSGSPFMVRRAWVLTLAALFLFPMASATEGRGTFTTQGAVSFPAGTRLEGAPLAVFVPDAAQVTDLRIEVPQGTVFEFTARFQGVGLLPSVQLGNTDVRKWTVTDAVVSLTEGDHSGFFGVYSEPGSKVVVEGQVQEEPAAASGIGNGKSTDGEAPESFNYFHEIATPHMRGEGQGRMEYTGMGGVKLRGPDVEIRSSNVTRHETGKKQTGPTEETATWLYIRFDAPATLSAGEAPFQIATAEATAAWDGTLLFRPTDGRLQAQDETYLPRGGTVELEGTFTARLAPLPGGRTARMDLSGDMRSSSLLRQAPVPVPSSSPLEGVPLLLVIGAAVALGGGAGAYLWHRHRQQDRALLDVPADAEFFTDMADVWIAAEDYGRGLHWMRRAREKAPTSARLAADEAFCLAKLGRLEEALKAWEEAHAVASDGDPAFGAAGTLLEIGAPLEVVEKWLGRALEKSPGLVLQAEETFPEVVERPGWEAMARRAWDRLEEGWRP